MAYGTPTGPENLLTFYTDVRRGRPPTPEQLADLARRYEAIGGISPLSLRTQAQIASIQGALDGLAPGEFTTYYGTKHADPKIEATLAEIAAAGHTQVIALVLAPHFSVLSVGEYLTRAKESAKSLGLTIGVIERWGEDPMLIALLAERLLEAQGALGIEDPGVEYLFTAHSLPIRILEMGDRYPEELAATARLVAERLALPHHRTGWQSAGRTPEPWLGPDLLAVLDELAAQGFRGVIVCPAGFTSDHLEVLYDIDIEAQQRASSLGLVLARTRSLNDDPALGELLAHRILAARVALDDQTTR